MSQGEAVEYFKRMGIYSAEEREKLRFTYGTVNENRTVIKLETSTSTGSELIVKGQEDRNA